MKVWFGRKSRATSDTAEALADCLARVERGESAQEALARFPGLRDELAPLLALAANLRQAAPDALPDDARLRLRYELRGAARVLLRRRQRPIWRPLLLRLATATLVVALLMGGTLVAAARSAPGTPLRPLGLALEGARLRLPLPLEERLVGELDLLEHTLADSRARLERRRADVTMFFVLAGRTDDWLARYLAAPPPLADPLRPRVLALVRAEQTFFQEALDGAPPGRLQAAHEALLALAHEWETSLLSPPRPRPPVLPPGHPGPGGLLFHSQGG